MKFEVTILGCGSAVPTLSRTSSTQLVNYREKYFLLDCAEGTQHNLKKYNIRMQRIKHIFITHAHADHFLGLPGLLSTMSLLGRTQEIHIYAAPGIESFLRSFGEVTYGKLQFEVHYHTLNYTQPEKLYEDSELIIRSVPLKHSAPCCGFILEEKPKLRPMIPEKIAEYNIPHYVINNIKEGNDFFTEDGERIPYTELTKPPEKQYRYAYMTDTVYNPELVEKVAGVDVLYHEATFLNDQQKRAKETKHATAEEAAKIARDAKVGRLFLGHFSARYKHLDGFLEEARPVFKNTYLGEDGLTIKLY